MADIFSVCEIVERMADGFAGSVTECIGDNAAVVRDAILEQIYSGLDGEDKLLSPTYDNDPYFDEPGEWYHRGQDYKAWKMSITPPAAGTVIGLPPRPPEVPNLFITGKFYGEVSAVMRGDTLSVESDPSGSGPDIVAKYGDSLLHIGGTATGYFNERYLIPHIWSFFEDCGY